MLANRNLTATAIAKDPNINHNNVNRSTISRFLNAEGLHARIKRKTCLLNATHIAKRFKWA